MTLAENWRQMRFLAGVVVVSTAVILAALLFGFLNQHGQVASEHRQASRDHALLVGVEANATINIETSARTECIRKLAAAVDDERWNLVGEAFHVATAAEAAKIGVAISTIPQSLDVADHGGTIGKHHYDKCPAPPTPTSPDTGGTTP